ncbi:MAG: YabP/YqfC family sporulation protein [Clostridia bacterium]|nr:YabP/YqfC family sporulation protein [Clostridia bacterium]
MSFIDNIYEALGEELLPDAPSFRALLIGGRACYVENAKSIIKYSEQEVAVAIPKGQILIKGEALNVKKYCEGDLVVCGKITGIERV